MASDIRNANQTQIYAASLNATPMLRFIVVGRVWVGDCGGREGRGGDVGDGGGKRLEALRV